MSIRGLMVSILGLVGLVVPAYATFSYQSDVTDFNAAASGLTLSAITTFTTADLVATTPYGYDDPTTLVDFLDTASNGVTPREFTVSGSELVQHLAGDIIEITLPSAVYAFAGTFEVASSFQSECIEPGVGSFSLSCNSPTTILTSPTFIGITSDVAFTTIFLGPETSGTAQLELESFQIGTNDGSQTPEIASVVAIATGLLCLGIFRRRLKRLSV